MILHLIVVGMYGAHDVGFWWNVFAPPDPEDSVLYLGDSPMFVPIYVVILAVALVLAKVLSLDLKRGRNAAALSIFAFIGAFIMSVGVPAETAKGILASRHYFRCPSRDTTEDGPRGSVQHFEAYVAVEADCTLH